MEKENKGRRSFLEKVACVGVGSMGVLFSPAIERSKAAETCTTDVGTNCGGSGGYPIQISYNDTFNNQGIRRDLVTGLTQGKPTTTSMRDYWSIIVEVSSNASTPETSDCNLCNQINDSFIRYQWDEGKYSNETNVIATTDKWHLGASAAGSASNNNYHEYAAEAVKFGAMELIELAPYGQYLADGAELLMSMYDEWASSNVDTQKWRSDFNWSTFENRVFQASYWTKVEVRLGQDQSLTLDIKDGVDTIGHFPLSTNFNYTVNAPSVSASSVQEMSTMEARSNDIIVVSSKEMKRNPETYGWTQRRANQLAKGEDVYIYAPSKTPIVKV